MPVVVALVEIEFPFLAAMSAKLTAVPVSHGPVRPVMPSVSAVITKFFMPVRF